MKRVYTAFWLGIFNLLFLFLIKNSDFVTGIYADVIHPFLLQTLGRAFAWYPWSVAELIIYLIMVLCVGWLVRLIEKRLHKNPGWEEYFKSGMKNLCLGAMVFLTLFALTEGPNYYRTSFAEQYQIVRKEYTDEELIYAYELLKEKVNDLALKVPRDEQGLMEISGNGGWMAVKAMKRLGTKYTQLSGYYPQPKKVAFSQALSLMDITGIYTPFTLEANYNRDILSYNQPFTMCHELSHLKGFMQEQEANFIAYLACEQSESLEFQYSGAMLGLIYCGNELYKRAPEIYKAASGEICPEASLDLDENTRYWNTYEGIISTFSQKVNDVYLKLNHQENGVKSYDQVVDYIVQHLNAE